MSREKTVINLLGLTTIAVYAVVATGAALGSTRPVSECSSWPFCTGDTSSLLAGGDLLVLTHRGLTLLAGLLLLTLVGLTVRSSLSRTVSLPIYAGAILFPVQIAVGAAVVLSQSPTVTQVHLGVAVVIFVTLLYALGRGLDESTAAEVNGSSAHQPAEQLSSQPATESPTNAQAGTDANLTEQHVTTPASPSLSARLRAYLELTKPRLMWLLCLLALAGIALATTTGASVDGLTVMATLTGGILAVGASGTFNHAIEFERDKQMDRTSDRPVATAAVSRRSATLFGVSLVVLSLSMLWMFVNPLATALTFLAIIYYSVIYTVVLKPNTTWNIAIGGGAGALPAVIGWAAVTGDIGLPAVALAAVVVIWTPAHFYNLAIVYRDDYANAGYPMYSVVKGIPATRQRILTTLGGTLLVTAFLAAVSPLGWLFTVAVVLAGALFLATVIVQFRRRTPKATLRSFHASNAYLGVLLAAIIVEALIIIP